MENFKRLKQILEERRDNIVLSIIILSIISVIIEAFVVNPYSETANSEPYGPQTIATCIRLDDEYYAKSLDNQTYASRISLLLEKLESPNPVVNKDLLSLMHYFLGEEKNVTPEIKKYNNEGQTSEETQELVFEKISVDDNSIEENSREESIEFAEISIEDSIEIQNETTDNNNNAVEIKIEEQLPEPEQETLSPAVIDYNSLDADTKEAVRLIALCIDKESNGSIEDDYGVGSVVVNRVNHSAFSGSTVYEILTARYQYAWVNESSINEIPTQESIDVAYDIYVNGNNRFPSNVVFQAQFVQGDGIYETIGVHYYCYIN